MAVALILLLIAIGRQQFGYVTAAAVVHAVNMIAPQTFGPAAVAWSGLSRLSGMVASRVILALVFFAIVTPIARWRKLAGADSLQLKAFRQSRASVMHARHHRFTGRDIEQPY